MGKKRLIFFSICLPPNLKLMVYLQIRSREKATLLTLMLLLLTPPRCYLDAREL